MSIEYSVIITYYNRSYEINLLLMALSLQEYPKDKFEVILVNDGSGKNIDHIVHRYKNDMNLFYYYIDHTGNRGIVRNFGAEKSQGEKLIFFDADTIPPRDTISNFHKQINDKPQLVSLGYRYYLLELDYDYIDENTIKNKFDIIRNLPALNDGRMTPVQYRKLEGKFYRGKWQLLYSHCFCIWKEQFDKTGGFDPDFGYDWGAEDNELGYRLFLNGCTLEMNEDVRCFHFFHREVVSEKIGSLNNNLNIFLSKYPHWSVELFIREFEIWSIELITIQEQIMARDFLVQGLEHPGDIITSLPDRTVVCGIEDERLIASEKVSLAYIPESRLTKDKIQNTIGIMTPWEEKSFHAALISWKYLEINPGMYIMLFKEMSRIAQKVYSVNEETIMDVTGEIQRSLLFNISHFFSLYKTNYSFLHLALAMQKQGVRVGLNIELDIFSELDITSGFLCPGDEENQRIRQILDHGLNFAGDEIPCIMDRENVRSSERSQGTRIMWQELCFINQERDIMKNYLPFYNRVLVKRKQEQEMYPNTMKPGYLPQGVNVKKLEVLQAETRKKPGPFTIVWADQFTDTHSNLESIVDVFMECFARDPGIRLKIVTIGNRISYHNNFIFNKGLNLLYRGRVEYLKVMYDAYLKKLIEKSKDCENIVFKTDVMTEEEYFNELIQADVYINLHATTELSPLVLASVALGKKPVILATGSYEDYFSSEMCFPVHSSFTPVIAGEPVIESPRYHERDPSRYFLAFSPEKESLGACLGHVYTKRETIAIEADKVAAFKEKFNWDAVASRLMKILYDHPSS